MSEKKLSKEELDKLAKDILELCKQEGITKPSEIKVYMEQLFREAKISKLLDDEN